MFELLIEILIHFSSEYIPISLNKLDLTLNFVGELTTGLECLQSSEFLQHLFLMGNPCTEFPHYRDYVIAKLPQVSSIMDTHIITKYVFILFWDIL